MRFSLFVILFFFPFFTYAQLTKVRGKVIDAATKEPLAFVSIAFQGTTIGVISDIDGNYHIETRTTSDTLIFSYVGYSKEVRKIKRAQFQEIDVELTASTISLQEIVVKPSKNPALILLDSLHAHRSKNNIDRLKFWESEVYNKMEFDVSNVDENFKKNSLFKQFQFIFDYVDTSLVSGKSYLPIFITETVSDLYYQKNPKKEKEVIRATNVSGVKNDQLSQFTGQMYLKVNPYDNFLQLFGKGFVSPLATFGTIYYKYYLIDSAYINNRWCYQISYLPKRSQEPTFTGNFWIHDTTYALSKINARLAKDANLNFVNDLIYDLEYQYVGDSLWFTKTEDIFIDFNISDNTAGIFGNKTTSYKNVVIGEKRDDNFFNPQLAQEYITLDSVNKFSDDEWKMLRHMELTEKELQIYDMVDSIKQVPIFQTWVDVINTLVNGHYIYKFFEIGPYYKLYSFNAIEGNRFRFGGRTSNDFSTKIMLTGHVAYGEGDKRWKFATGGLYMFNKNPRKAAGWNVKHDIEQLGISQNAFTQDNILASFLRRTYNRKLTMVDEAEIFLEYEWFQGLSNTLKINTRQIWSTEYVPFVVFANGEQKNLEKLPSTEITLNTRYAYNEKFLLGEFLRISLGTNYPILNLDLTAGLKGVLNSEYEYYRIHASVEHGFSINPIGRLKYILDMGMYFGNAPYPLLQLHEGNETYAYDNYAFNMMNYYEFVSDKYVSLLVEHHFDGFFFNKIPLFRKLKWREVVAAKGLIGGVSDKNMSLMQFPEGLRELTVPYVEASAGIENIFRLFRIDAMWRLTYLDYKENVSNQTEIPRFGIRVQLKFEF